MKSEQEFRKSLAGKQIPLLVLDQKWHRLFAIHGKTDKVRKLEEKLNGYLARQGKLNTDIKNLKIVKNQLMSGIMEHMGEEDERVAKSARDKKLEENKRLIDEANEKMEAAEEELMELPKKIRETNEELMIESMDFCYDYLKINEEEAKNIEEWINEVRVELKKNIIRKQNREINNREMYAYMHDVFGAEVIDIFDMKYGETPDKKDEQAEAEKAENAKQEEAAKAEKAALTEAAKAAQAEKTAQAENEKEAQTQDVQIQTSQEQNAQS